MIKWFLLLFYRKNRSVGLPELPGGAGEPHDVFDGEEDCRERVNPHNDIDGNADMVIINNCFIPTLRLNRGGHVVVVETDASHSTLELRGSATKHSHGSSVCDETGKKEKKKNGKN